MCIMGNGNDPPARIPPGNFLMKNMNPTNSAWPYSGEAHIPT